jgi:hypothetical protein
MTRRNVIFVSLLLIFITFSIAAKYYKFAVAQDFYVSAELSCDTETESCFVWDCDLEDEECDQTPYKYIWKYAANVPQCNPLSEDCDELTCEADEEDCEIIYCSEDTVGEEEFCYTEN